MEYLKTAAKDLQNSDLMLCTNCGLYFNMADLGDVVAHLHESTHIMETEHRNLREISHSKEVLPNASIHFCIGANNALRGNYDEQTLYLENSDFKAGYWFAKESMIDKYILV